MKVEPDTLARLNELVGHLSATQQEFVAKCMQEDPSGVWRVAQQINGNLDQLHSPVAVFIKRLSDGVHVITPRMQERSRVYDALPKPSPEKEAHYRSIAQEWKLIQSYMETPEIKMLFHELKATCRNPDEPTNEEAARVRSTLIFAIDDHWSPA